jgi:opacity protein-like surface antigen
LQPLAQGKPATLRLALAAVALCVAGSAFAQAQVVPTPPDYPRGKISGYIFADYYDNLAGDPTHHYNASGQDSDKVNIDNSSSSQIGRDLNGVQVRRVYFQLDNDLSVKYSTRVRLEIDGKSLTSDGKIGANVKAAYMLAKSMIPRGDFYFGMMSTPSYETAEDFWQYRSIEKTIADFRGIGSSADLGIELKGAFDPDHRFSYAAMIGNGVGQKPEDNRYKKFYLALPAKLGDFRIEPYVDYENAFKAHDRATYKIFAGYEHRLGAIGVELLDRNNHNPGAISQNPRGFSVFARTNPVPTFGAFARFDSWDPDRNLVNHVNSQLWIAGVDWQPIKDVHFMPNVEATQYDAKGTAVAPRHHDLQARLTVFYKFSKPQS